VVFVRNPDKLDISPLFQEDERLSITFPRTRRDPQAPGLFFCGGIDDIDALRWLFSRGSAADVGIYLLFSVPLFSMITNPFSQPSG
jgi:hypothetical protein